MSNWIDRVQAWAERHEDESLGEFVFRAWMVMLGFSTVTGLFIGLIFGLCLGDWAYYHPH